MKLNELKASDGSRKTSKRKGMGIGSGNGKTAGRGHKGQKSRTGGKVARGFEGGQMPLIRRVPKRGFTPRTRTEFQLVNLQQLNRFDDGATVDAATLFDAGLVRNAVDSVKLLAKGALNKRISISVAAASTAAIAAVEAAGGTIKMIANEG